MTPHDLGFPIQFDSFRPAQLEAIEHVLTSEKRFIAIGAPPGVGKSVIALALAKLLGGRTVILTANRGLENQYMRSLDGMGMVNIQGRQNYQCWSGGTCEDGGRAGCADKVGCPYLCAYRVSLDSEIVLTNYAYWLAIHTRGQGMGEVDTLIADEAGLASEWLSRALDFSISEKDVHTIRAHNAAGVNEQTSDDLAEWVKRGALMQPAAERHYVQAKAAAARLYGTARERALRDLKRAERILDACTKLCDLDANWVCERRDGTDDGRVWGFECIWPGRYRERLFRFVERVVLMSATLRPKTLQLLGIPRDQCDFREWPRQFPAANGPVVWVPTARVNHRISEEANEQWLDRIREIAAWGRGRHGLIHTVSYARARRVADVLSHCSTFVNGAADPDSASAREVYERFIGADKPSILVSPSFSTGWDFPGRSGEWQVIAKIAFPDTRSKVMQARVASDPMYPFYLAAQDLVQGCGRIVRSETDRGTSLIIDNAWEWFGSRAKEFMPKWFRVRREERLPEPLPRIEEMVWTAK